MKYLEILEYGKERMLEIVAPGASTMPYIRSLKVDGKAITSPTLKHGQIVHARKIEFEMSATPTSWGNLPLW